MAQPSGAAAAAPGAGRSGRAPLRRASGSLAGSAHGKLLILCLGTMVWWCTPPVRAMEQLPAAPLVEELLARFARSAGMRAEFLQINRWVVLEEPDSARGLLTVSPPHRFRLEYTEPAGHRMGCDGRYVWTYIPEERQVLRAAWRETTGWGDFFLQSLKEGADSLVTVREVPGGRRVAFLKLGPRPEWGLRELEMEIDLATGNPRAYGYIDEEGNRVRFEFLTVSFPKSLDDELFHFTVPESYELLDVG